jgi:hypothetical protein
MLRLPAFLPLHDVLIPYTTLTNIDAYPFSRPQPPPPAIELLMVDVSAEMPQEEFTLSETQELVIALSRAFISWIHNIPAGLSEVG